MNGQAAAGFESNRVRIPLLGIQAFVALTAFAGGTALVIGSLNPDAGSVLVPPPDFLEGSPFSSYAIPGVLLGVLLGGLHLIAFLTLLRRHRWAYFISAAAGVGTLIWIFVQMIFIPYSALQTVYFITGLAELGFVLLALGVLRPMIPPREGSSGDRR